MEHVLRPQSKVSMLTGAIVLGASVILGSLFTPISVHAAALTSTNVQPASLVAGATSTVTISFTTTTTIPNNGRVEVTFPSGFDVSGATGGACTSMDGTFTTLVSGQTVRLVRQGDGTGQTAAAETCTVNNIVNPTVAGSTGTYSIQTMDNVPAQLDNDNAVAADTIVAATLTSTNVQPDSLRTRTSNKVTVTFTTVNTLANNGKVKVTFPSGFNVANAASGSCTSMDGTFTTSVAGQVVTLTRGGDGTSEPAGAQTCTISGIINPTNVGAGGTYTIATTNSSDATHDQDTAVASDNFTSSSSADEEEEEVTYSVNLLTPEDGDSFEAGSMTDITWESEGGQASYVNLYYSEDGGTTWETIVTNALNDGEYTWTTPHVDSDEVVVKVVTTDLAEELATDTSAAFSIWYYADDEEDVVEEEEGSDDYTDEEIPEDIDGIMAGDYIKLEDSSTIYYVDEYMMRRPFYDAQTYFTYEDDFDAVVEVSADTMAEFTIGAPMLPKAGVVLVKIQSVAKVYMVEESSDGSFWLRWITSEDVAEEMFGSNWASYVVDVDSTLFTRYEVGEDVEEAEDVDTDMMKYRTDLHE